MESIEKRDKRGNIYALLGIIYALIQMFWTYFVCLYFKNNGVLSRITSPFGFLPGLFFNLIISIPMIVVLIGAIVKYKREFDDTLMYIKTERYLLTLILTAVYAFMMPLAAKTASTPEKGVTAWFYYLLIVAFLEEFLFRGLVPTLMDRSSFPSWIMALIPAILYGMYQSALPFAQYGITAETLRLALPDILWSTVFHFALITMKKWTGAMWLPIIAHSIIDLSIYLIF